MTVVFQFLDNLSLIIVISFILSELPCAYNWPTLKYFCSPFLATDVLAAIQNFYFTFTMKNIFLRQANNKITTKSLVGEIHSCGYRTKIIHIFQPISLKIIIAMPETISNICKTSILILSMWEGIVQQQFSE